MHLSREPSAHLSGGELLQHVQPRVLYCCYCGPLGGHRSDCTESLWAVTRHHKLSGSTTPTRHLVVTRGQEPGRGPGCSMRAVEAGVSSGLGARS